jgi:hypothetical protein
MATVTRTTTWVDNQVLTATALNGEFNNLLNALALDNDDIAAGAGIVGSKLASPLTGVTMTKPVINGTNPTAATYTPATGSQTVALDCSANNMHFVTGHASGTAITFTVTGVTNSQPFIVSILQGAVVSTIAAWFSGIKWAGGSAPTLTATTGKTDSFGFMRVGTDSYLGFIVGQNC